MEEPIITDLSLDWDEIVEPKKAEENETYSAADALLHSLADYGKVDFRYIIKLTGLDYQTVREQLRGAIFQNPEKWNKSKFDGFETADEYLSGNLYYKYLIAKRANEVFNDYFKENVDAIKSVMPKMLSSDNIYVTLGTPWVPRKIVEGFIKRLLDITTDGFLVHDSNIGTWEIKEKAFYLNYVADSVKCRITYGTSRISAIHIIEKLLNNQSILIYDEPDALSYTSIAETRTVNRKETLLALEKAQLIKEEFANYIEFNEEIRKKIERVYTLKMGTIRRRVFDGSFLTFPGINKQVTLYRSQKNAVARIILTPNTLLAHEVGAGKTYIMIAAGRELRRMGISKKNLYVVPNNIVKQWEEQFYLLYPDIRLKTVLPKDFTPKKRNDVLRDIRDNDYDAVLMAYSSFDLIPLSVDYFLSDLESQIKEIENLIDLKGTTGVTNRLKSKLEKLRKKQKELSVKIENSEMVFFDELKVNTLFVDEAHNYKNVPFETKSMGILGVNSAGSTKCRNFYEKVKCVQKQNDGRGAVFATGTPITNSISDIFVMQTYLQSGLLAQTGLLSFDAWVGNFAEKVSAFEVDVDTNKFRMAERFCKFHNLTELTSMLAMFSDFYQNTEREDLPEFDGYTDSVVPKTPELRAYLKLISSRADKVRAHKVKRTEDNMLKITTDGRKAALDVRLVNDKANFSLKSKVYVCSDNVYKIYVNSAETNGTQLVFCDSSTPKAGLNMYDELKRLLVDRGIPEEEIAYIHDAKSDKEKNEILEDTRASKIRVLIGSTWKLGIGVNVQDHLIAMHHLDVPWRPADMVQREGRIIRQGNLNSRVYIFRYITEGSFDAYSWQLLETKQRFINELLAGTLAQRNASDVGDTVLNYAEVKALAIGNPKIKERVETANELSKVITLKKRADELRQQMAEQKEQMPSLIEKREKILYCAKLDYEHIKTDVYAYSAVEERVYGEQLVEALQNNGFKKEETLLFYYKGFGVILPVEMPPEKPYVVMKNNGRYKLDMSYSAQGVITRIQNFIDGFEKVVAENENTLNRLIAKDKGLDEELAKPDLYTEQIALLRKKLKYIDKQLGVTV